MNRAYPALRGIAILLVVLNHSAHMVLQAAGPARLAELNPLIVGGLGLLQAFGVFAVPIFLFLSGCFFAYAAGKGDWAANYRVVWSNVKHVGAPYLLWSLVFYALIFLFHGERISLAGTVKNLLVGYPFNFVPLLIFNYLVSPILIRLFRRLGWWLIALVGLYQLFLLFILQPAEVGLQLPGALRMMAPPVLGTPLADWAIFFPLGLAVVLRAGQTTPVISRLRYVLAGLTVLLFLLGLADIYKWVSAPYARQLCPLPFILLSTTFQRARIPAVRSLELLGKRAYGLYLTNLIVLDLTLLALDAAAPGLTANPHLLVLPLFAWACFLPLWMMSVLERRVKPLVFRYAFG